MSRITQQKHGSGGGVIPDKKEMLNSTATTHWILRNTAQMHEVLGLISTPGNSKKTNSKSTILRGMGSFWMENISMRDA